MSDRIEVAGLAVASPLYDFVTEVALPGTGIEPDRFWNGVAAIFGELAPRNRELLEIRARIQAKIDDFHRAAPGPVEEEKYLAFLREIGYLVDDPGEVTATTAGVDAEIAEQAGPQLVVPLLNRRFAANAVNARWGSLYDALYGTDAIDRDGDLAPGSSYNATRGAAVVARVREFLDSVAPLADGSHADAAGYLVVDGALSVARLAGGPVGLADPAQFLGYRGAVDAPEAIVLVHNGLHLEILIDRSDPIGSADAAGVKDVLLESAITTIMDLEDSVAAVDAEDKVLGYTNWLELMAGTLAEEVTKNGKSFTRRMNPDRAYTAADGSVATLRGRSLLFIRQVGHLMTTDAILDGDGHEVPEGILDAIMTGLGSLRDLRDRPVGEDSGLHNSVTGNMGLNKRTFDAIMEDP